MSDAAEVESGAVSSTALAASGVATAAPVDNSSLADTGTSDTNSKGGGEHRADDNITTVRWQDNKTARSPQGRAPVVVGNTADATNLRSSPTGNNQMGSATRQTSPKTTTSTPRQHESDSAPLAVDQPAVSAIVANTAYGSMHVDATAPLLRLESSAISQTSPEDGSSCSRSPPPAYVDSAPSTAADVGVLGNRNVNDSNHNQTYHTSIEGSQSDAGDVLDSGSGVRRGSAGYAFHHYAGELTSSGRLTNGGASVDAETNRTLPASPTPPRSPTYPIDGRRTLAPNEPTARTSPVVRSPAYSINGDTNESETPPRSVTFSGAHGLEHDSNVKDFGKLFLQQQDKETTNKTEKFASDTAATPAAAATVVGAAEAVEANRQVDEQDCANSQSLVGKGSTDSAESPYRGQRGRAGRQRSSPMVEEHFKVVKSVGGTVVGSSLSSPKSPPCRLRDVKVAAGLTLAAETINTNGGSYDDTEELSRVVNYSRFGAL